MRIVHITHQLPPETHGGVEAHVLSLASAQQDKGHDVTIIAGSLMPWDQVGGEEQELDGLSIWRVHRQDLYFDAWDRMYCPQMTDHILEKLGEWQPDVVHQHHWIRLSQDLGRQIVDAGYKLVLTLHDLATSCPRGFRMKPDGASCLEALNRQNCLHCAPRWPWMSDEETARELDVFRRSSLSELAAAHGVVCASQSVREIVTAGLQAPDLADRIRVVPFGHQPVFRAPAPGSREDDTFRLAFWGSITERKGVEMLVAAFRELCDNRSEGGRHAELHIFGVCDLPEREQALAEAAQDLPVTFHGRYDYDSIAALGVHAAVFPSRCIETYGLVLDEAFELGVPVVVPAIGALDERAGDAGQRFELNDPGSLACALGALVEDPALYQRLLEAVPRSLPSFDGHVESVLALYAEPMNPPLAAHQPISVEERLRHQLQRAQPLFQKLLEKGEGEPYGPR